MGLKFCDIFYNHKKCKTEDPPKLSNNKQSMPGHLLLLALCFTVYKQG